MSGGIGAFEDTEKTDSTGKVYRNIEDAAQVKKIKDLEDQLLKLRESNRKPIMQKVEELEERLVEHKSNAAAEKAYVKKEKALLQELLNAFIELLKSPYGSLGYLVSSTSGGIEQLYGVDTDRDFYTLDGRKIRVPNKTLDPAIIAGAGRRWLGESSPIISNPSETPYNEKTTDHAVQEISAAIKLKIKELTDK